MRKLLLGLALASLLLIAGCGHRCGACRQPCPCPPGAPGSAQFGPTPDVVGPLPTPYYP
ncbi:MAG: hypothetical protein L0Z62_48470 [Gemmataceae bacterium]|nr:hypothetical protein [Gemmataceae bacterium]